MRIEDMVWESEEDVQKDYEERLALARTKIIKVKDRIKKFQKKVEECEGLEKKKYQFLL